MCSRIGWCASRRTGVIEKDGGDDGSGAKRYRLTAKGIDLLPVMLDMIGWSAKYDPKTAADKSFIRRLRRDRGGLEVELRRGCVFTDRGTKGGQPLDQSRRRHARGDVMALESS